MEECRDARFERFVALLASELDPSLVGSRDGNTLDDLVEAALDVWLELPVQQLSRVHAIELERLVERAWALSHAFSFPIDPRRYAFELRLVRRGNVDILTRAGRALLATPGIDALRLLLALEVTQSLGPSDDFRMSSLVAAELCENPSRLLLGGIHAARWVSGLDEWPYSTGTLRRLAAEGLVDVDAAAPHRDAHQTITVTNLGMRLLSEVVGVFETPWTIAAQALIEEERGAAMAEWSPALERAQGQRTADVTVREAQLVAHELRNALAPVRIHLDRLYGKVASAAPDLDLAQLRAPIDNGISRAFAFVDEQTQVAAIVDRAAESFDLDGALRDLAARHPQAHASLGAPDATIRGARRTFLLVMSDLVENAVQSDTTRPVNVSITSKRDEGAVVVFVDDDGPGVPDDIREKVFDPGFSTRGSSGQGLGSARDFVQRTLGGTLTLEARDAGGTRVRITLPLDRTVRGAS